MRNTAFAGFFFPRLNGFFLKKVANPNRLCFNRRWQKRLMAKNTSGEKGLLL